MGLFDILGKTEAINATNLTIREQTRLAENPLDLRFPGIFPRKDEDSIKFSEITTVDFRPVGGRREFNAQGREIPERVGPQRDLEMTPINPTKHLDERALTLLKQRAGHLAQLIQAGIVKDVNAWATTLADAVHRQIEADAFEAWFKGQITAFDPKVGGSVVASLQFDAARYPVEADPWNDPDVDAYDRLLFHCEAAIAKLGSLGVIRLRRATINEVVKDAPNGANLIRPTVANIADRLSEEGFGQITIAIDERTYDAFTDGSSKTTPTKYVPTGLIGFQPANGVVGRTHYAPVTRAFDYVQADRVNQRDVAIFYSEKNEGKTLLIEGEAFAVPLPDENSVYVANAGV